MFPRTRALLVSLLLGALVVLGAMTLRAQLESGERGIPPIDSSGSYEVTGVTVDVASRDPEAARQAAWRLAQRKGWASLYARTNHVAPEAAPALGDSALESIVAGIEVEQENIGPTRYIARLTVLFDRARAGKLLGVKGPSLRSAPMLLIPVQISGGTATSFEIRNPWQAAWAKFRTGGSPIDYVRPVGTGADPLLLNIGQTHRPSRDTWRGLLDQYGAADILVAEVRLKRLWPGGPVVGHFLARHGPDNKLVGDFTLRVRDGDALPALLSEGVLRIDAIYARALREGRLRSDASLVAEEPLAPVEDETTLDEAVAAAIGEAASGSAITVQVDTPDAAALNAAEAALRGISGVEASTTTSLALGGVSVIRVSYAGSIDSLRAALAARGWRVEAGADALRIRRAGQ